MIALETLEPLPVDEWTHIALTYDGSSRAAGLKLYLNGAPAERRRRARQPDAEHPAAQLSADVFDSFVGLAVRHAVPREGAGRQRPRRAARLQARSDAARSRVPARRDAAAVARPKPSLPSSLTATRRAASSRRAGALTAARGSENKHRDARPAGAGDGRRAGAAPTYVLNRGVYSERGERSRRAGLDAVLPVGRRLPQNRLGLARWLFDRQASADGARLRESHVADALRPGARRDREDFGSQGSIPTHPELLDWLAVEFMESGWDVKELHQLIVMSATYRQSSDATDELLRGTPPNALLARGPR